MLYLSLLTYFTPKLLNAHDDLNKKTEIFDKNHKMLLAVDKDSAIWNFSRYIVIG